MPMNTRGTSGVSRRTAKRMVSVPPRETSCARQSAYAATSTSTAAAVFSASGSQSTAPSTRNPAASRSTHAGEDDADANSRCVTP